MNNTWYEVWATNLAMGRSGHTPPDILIATCSSYEKALELKNKIEDGTISTDRLCEVIKDQDFDHYFAENDWDPVKEIDKGETPIYITKYTPPDVDRVYNLLI